MMGRRLRPAARRDSPERTPFTRLGFLTLVPDSADGITRTVELYACLLQHDSPAVSQARFRSQGHLDQIDICTSIYCLSPEAAGKLVKELRIIAEMSIHRDVRIAALMKLVELELSK
ncbi:MAG: hypothetical protein AB1529_06680 [Candidatus Micrarchaeota archaeon]